MPRSFWSRPLKERESQHNRLRPEVLLAVESFCVSSQTNSWYFPISESSLCFSIFQNSFSLLRLTYVATKFSAASIITSASSPDVPSRPVPRTVGHSLKSQLNARLRKKSNQNDSLHGHSPANPIATSVSPFAVPLQHSNVTRFTSCRSAWVGRLVSLSFQPAQGFEAQRCSE